MYEPDRPILSQPRILVVEDDVASRSMLVRLLSNHQLEVHSCSSGKEAFEKLQYDRGFDIILSDWSMPSMDGIELLTCLRDTPDLRSIYFIMITSKDEMEDKVNALNAGADDYVTKPYHHQELLARVRAGLRIRGLQKELLELEKRMAILQVATAAGHEINNPLTGVFGFLDLIRDGLEAGADKETLIDYLDRVYIQNERIRNIVSNLMTLKEIEVKPYIGDQRMINLHIDNGQESEEEGKQVSGHDLSDPTDLLRTNPRK